MQQPFSFERVLLVTILGIGVLIGYSVFASSEDDIVYPIAQLAGCVDENECRAYCDDADHLAECLDFAELHNLFTDEELEHARRFEALGAVGPGGCQSEDECEVYCEDISNIDECLAFAEQHGFMDSDELEEGVFNLFWSAKEMTEHGIYLARLKVGVFSKTIKLVQMGSD